MARVTISRLPSWPFLLAFLFLLLSKPTHSFSWFSSTLRSPSPPAPSSHSVAQPSSPSGEGTRRQSGDERADAGKEQEATARGGTSERNPVAPFDAESLSITARSGERKGRELQERAGSAVSRGERRADGSVEAYESGKTAEEDNCWVTAYQQLMGSCKEVLRNEAWKAQLALRLTNCFLASSGRAPVDCRSSSNSRGSGLQVYMQGRAEGREKREAGVEEENCIKSMSDHEHSVFLAFFIDAPNMCHFLQSEVFKNEVETSVNSLKRTAHWLEEQLGDLSGSAEDMQAAAQASLHLQQRIAEEQGAVQQQVAALSESAHHAQAVLESLTGQQAAMAAEITQGVRHLEDQVHAVDAALQQSLQQQQAAAAEQAAAAQQMEVIRQQQAAALDQHRRVLQELSEMATAEQRSTGKWQEEMAQLQEELLAGQRQAAGDMKRIAVEQATVAERQNEVMGELAARTVAYHMSSQRWQARMSEEQQVLLAVQQQVAGRLSAVAVEAERQHKVLATWNERMEATQEQLLGNAERILAVQNDLSRKQGSMMRALEQFASLFTAIRSYASTISTFLLYLLLAPLSLLLTCSSLTSCARRPLLSLVLTGLLLELGLLSALSSVPMSQGPTLSVVRGLLATAALLALCLAPFFPLRFSSSSSHPPHSASIPASTYNHTPFSTAPHFTPAHAPHAADAGLAAAATACSPSNFHPHCSCATPHHPLPHSSSLPHSTRTHLATASPNSQGTCLAPPQCMALDEDDRECEGQGEVGPIEAEEAGVAGRMWGGPVDNEDKLPELQPDRQAARGSGGEGWQSGLGEEGEGHQQQWGSRRCSEGDGGRGERARTRAMARQVVERSLARQRTRLQAAAASGSAARQSHESVADLLASCDTAESDDEADPDYTPPAHISNKQCTRRYFLRSTKGGSD
ncbi:hypothetical protein CLOM_g16929 [Closterium sp. NIES-68]|nr:hypothetical protein CLOM_g16929 [Closterium sp. NIES-68]GJP65338.1 hypothetical protein CLOP_g22235 [Closterium sp. NIES-67]